MTQFQRCEYTDRQLMTVSIAKHHDLNVRIYLSVAPYEYYEINIVKF